MSHLTFLCHGNKISKRKERMIDKTLTFYYRRGITHFARFFFFLNRSGLPSLLFYPLLLKDSETGNRLNGGREGRREKIIFDMLF